MQDRQPEGSLLKLNTQTVKDSEVQFGTPQQSGHPAAFVYLTTPGCCLLQVFRAFSDELPDLAAARMNTAILDSPSDGKHRVMCRVLLV